MVSIRCFRGVGELRRTKSIPFKGFTLNIGSDFVGATALRATRSRARAAAKEEPAVMTAAAPKPVRNSRRGILRAIHIPPSHEHADVGTPRPEGREPQVRCRKRLRRKTYLLPDVGVTENDRTKSRL